MTVIEILLICVPLREIRKYRKTAQKKEKGCSPSPSSRCAITSDATPFAGREEGRTSDSRAQRQPSGPRDPQGPSSALRPSSTVKTAPHFGHFTLASLLTFPLCIPAQPAKLTVNINARRMFASLFISRPPFRFTLG
jgi:hypothetical protein